MIRRFLRAFPRIISPSLLPSAPEKTAAEKMLGKAERMIILANNA